MKKQEITRYLEKNGVVTPVHSWKRYNMLLHQETGWTTSSESAYEAQQQRRQEKLKALLADNPIFRVSRPN